MSPRKIDKSFFDLGRGSSFLNVAYPLAGVPADREPRALFFCGIG